MSPRYHISRWIILIRTTQTQMKMKKKTISWSWSTERSTKSNKRWTLRTSDLCPSSIAKVMVCYLMDHASSTTITKGTSWEESLLWAYPSDLMPPLISSQTSSIGKTIKAKTNIWGFHSNCCMTRSMLRSLVTRTPLTGNFTTLSSLLMEALFSYCRRACKTRRRMCTIKGGKSLKCSEEKSNSSLRGWMPIQR